MGFAITIMLGVVVAIWLIATGLWTRATLESTAAVAAINGQAAYNRIRFASNISTSDAVAAAREVRARDEAILTANTVINYSMTRRQANIMGLETGSCTIPAATAFPRVETNPLVARNIGLDPARYIDPAIIRRQVSIGPVAPDVTVAVQLSARWRPTTLPSGVLTGAITSACVYASSSAIARKPE